MGLLDSIIDAESGGDSNAKNPNSSATGLGQFINSTWLNTLSRHRPDLVQGKSQDEILALRNDPQISREMTGAYAADNGAILKQNGHEATPGNTYLAHFLGPQGAITALRAGPSTPVSSILPSAARSNPFLQKMTVGDLLPWADRKAGGAPPRLALNMQKVVEPTPPETQPQQPAQQPVQQTPRPAPALNLTQTAPLQPAQISTAPQSIAPIPIQQAAIQKLMASFLGNNRSQNS